MVLFQQFSRLLQINRLVLLCDHGCTFILALPFARLEEIVFLGGCLSLLLLKLSLGLIHLQLGLTSFFLLLFYLGLNLAFFAFNVSLSLLFLLLLVLEDE